MDDVLVMEDVVTGYDNAPVLHGVSLAAAEGQVSVILGANGVGKTTALRVTSGQIRLWKGAITFAGRSTHRMSAERLVRAGMAIVPEPPAVFRDMPVIENLRVGGFALGGTRRDVEDRVDELLHTFPLLDERRGQLAGNLSGGEQRLLAVGRALMGRPKLLLVDEISMGLSPTAISTVFAMLGGLRRDGVTVCMVEQHIGALDIADRAYVMEKGRIVHEASGDLSQVREAVTSAYLGAHEKVSKR